MLSRTCHTQSCWFSRTENKNPEATLVRKPLFELKPLIFDRFRVSQRSCRGYLQNIRGAAEEGECLDEADHL